MKSIIFALILFSSISLNAQDTYKKTMKEFLIASNSQQIFEVMMDQLFINYKQQFPGIKQEILDKVRSEFDATILDNVVDLLVPIYKKHLTEQDMKEIIVFFKSPAGMKYVEKSPIIAQESVELGQAWSIQLAQKIVDRIKEEIELDKNKQ